MKVQFQISKHGDTIFSGAYDVTDADSFGQACTDAWVRIKQQRMERETSIGALVEHLDRSVLDQLNGASIGLSIAE
jgi:hypothetical protein